MYLCCSSVFSRGFVRSLGEAGVALGLQLGLRLLNGFIGELLLLLLVQVVVVLVQQVATHGRLQPLHQLLLVARDGQALKNMNAILTTSALIHTAVSRQNDQFSVSGMI